MITVIGRGHHDHHDHHERRDRSSQDSPRERERKRPPREPPYTIDAHIQFGRLSQTARDSFAAILGTSSGQVFGAGAELALRNGLFVRADVTLFPG